MVDQGWGLHNKALSPVPDSDTAAIIRDLNKRDFCLWNFINAGDQTYSMSYKHTEHIPAVQNGHTLERRGCLFGENRREQGGGVSVPHRFLPPAHVT